jgi:hypothetical protein
MRLLSVDVIGRWIRGAGLIAVVALAWELFVPESAFWTALAAVAFAGAAIAPAVIAGRRRSARTLAALTAIAAAKPVRPPRREPDISSSCRGPADPGALRPARRET